MTKLKTLKILPCPFCGSASKMKEISGNSDYDYNRTYYDIKCTNGECYLQDGAEWNFDTPEKAVQLWNKRDIKIERRKKIIQLDENVRKC
jgi:hypothetical protein